MLNAAICPVTNGIPSNGIGLETFAIHDCCSLILAYLRIDSRNSRVGILEDIHGVLIFQD